MIWGSMTSDTSFKEWFEGCQVHEESTEDPVKLEEDDSVFVLYVKGGISNDTLSSGSTRDYHRNIP